MKRMKLHQGREFLWRIEQKKKNLGQAVVARINFDSWTIEAAL